jgi:hypothetical protein
MRPTPEFSGRGWEAIIFGTRTDFGMPIIQFYLENPRGRPQMVIEPHFDFYVAGVYQSAYDQWAALIEIVIIGPADPFSTPITLRPCP